MLYLLLLLAQGTPVACPGPERLFPPACLTLAQQPPLPPPFPPPPMPPPPIDTNYAVSFEMKLETSAPAWFTPEQLGKPLDQIADNAYCEGRLQVGGSYRYYTNKKMPSALAGVLVPWPPSQAPPEDTSGTLELDGTTVILYAKDLVLGFRAVNATSNTTVITWNCQL